MLAIPDEHLLKFHACKDVKSLWESIKNRFGGNKGIKQNYENFTASSQEGLDKNIDRAQGNMENMTLDAQDRECTSGYIYYKCLSCLRWDSAKDKTGLGYDSQMNKSEVVHSVFNSRESNVDDSPVNDRFKIGKGFHAVPPALHRNYHALQDLDFPLWISDLSISLKMGLTMIVINDNVLDLIDQTKPKFTKINFVKSVNAAKQRSPRAAASISTARLVNITAPKPKVNDALPTTYSYFKAHSLVRRAFNQKSAAKTNNFNEKVNTARVNNVTTAGPKAVFSAAEGNGENVVKSSACWIWRPTGNVIDHTSKDSGSYMLKRFDNVDLQGRLNGCSRHMTGNKSFYTYYQEIDGGFVAFRGSPKGGKITEKGRTPNNGVAERSGPHWLFDIDLLTNSMNYEPSLEEAIVDYAGKKTNEKLANEGERNGQEKEAGASNKEGDLNVQDFRAELDNLLVQ
ncbi:hypothetical protein Tco_1547939 [Tanacetum coccineum]